MAPALHHHAATRWSSACCRSPATRADDLVVDLGSGDGRIVIAAAQKYGARAPGHRARRRAGAEIARGGARGAGRRAREVHRGRRAARPTSPRRAWSRSICCRDSSPAAAALHPGAQAGHAHRVARLHHGGLGARPQRDVRVKERHPGQGDESRLHLWIVPADVRGVWRGPGMEVRIEQNFQSLDVEGASRAHHFRRATSPGMSAVHASAHASTATAWPARCSSMGAAGRSRCARARAPCRDSSALGVERASSAARISSISSADLWPRISSRLSWPRPCSAEIEPPSRRPRRRRCGSPRRAAAIRDSRADVVVQVAVADVAEAVRSRAPESGCAARRRRAR